MIWVKCRKCGGESPVSEDDEINEWSEPCENCGFTLNEKDIYYEDEEVLSNLD